ncbi:MAG: DEAD/DEAH box helicase family protein [Cytophagales bacterium]|nr:DEAD/DEAH box helicase family protein [Cytophagales bacterium]
MQRVLDIPKPKAPRPHQKEAVQKAINHFNQHDIGTLVMPCGSGKTLTGLWIGQKLKARRVMVVVPTLYLQGQFIDSWLKDAVDVVEPQDILVVGSSAKKTINGMTVTTASHVVADFLNSHTGRAMLVFSTYQSSYILERALMDSEGVDLCIFDEAHRTAGEDKVAFQALMQGRASIKKKLFMTATPKYYRDSPSSDGQGALYTMDNKNLYGEVFYHLSIRDAIEQRIICDYKVVTLSHPSIDGHTDFPGEDRFRFRDVKTKGRYWAMATALLKAMSKYRIKKVIVFANTIRSSREFVDLLNKISGGTGTLAWHVDGKEQRMSERNTNLAAFSAAQIGVICNSRYLVEGYDLPSIDATLFLDEKSSIVDIVQAAGRSWRIADGKLCSYIMLPFFADSNHQVGMESLKRIFTALALGDRNVHERFSIGVTFGQVKTHGVLEDLEEREMRPWFKELLSELTFKVWRIANGGKTNYRSAQKAAEFTFALHEFGINNYKKWKAYCDNNDMFPEAPKKPLDIPKYLDLVYGDQFDQRVFFIDGRKPGDFLPMEAAAAFTKSLAQYGVFNSTQYQRYCRDHTLFPGAPRRPYNVPSKPWRTYKGAYLQELFFAQPSLNRGNFASAEECAKFTNSLAEFGVLTPKAFVRYAANPSLFPGAPPKPVNIPSDLRKAYKDEFVAIEFFKGAIARKKYQWKQVAEFTLSLGVYGIVNHVKWNEYCKHPERYPGAPPRPYGIPKNIRGTFKAVYKPSLFFTQGRDEGVKKKNKAQS